MASLKAKIAEEIAERLKAGDSIAMDYMHNIAKNPFKKSQGEFAMDVEPAGQYFTPLDKPPAYDMGSEYIVGKKEFKSPLVVDYGGSYSDSTNWKRELSNRYGGKKGKSLTNAVRKDGYDGILTVDADGDLSEAVDLFKGKGGVDMASLGAGIATLGALGASDESEAGGLGKVLSTAERMQRAADQGYIKTYHGSPVEIPESGFNMGDFAESDLGQGIYSTTSPYDASFNYADPATSQDFIGKLERRAEILSDDMGIDYDEAKDIAYKELVESPNIVPAMARTENPVRIGGDNETHFDLSGDVDIEATWDDASEQIAEQYADDLADMDADEVRELTEDLARELAYENDYVEEPAIFDALRNVSHRFDDVDIEQAIMDLREEGAESMSAEELIDALKGSEGIQYAMSGDTGEMASGELIRQAFEEAGHDSIIDATPNKKWGSESGRANYMPELEGTEHVITFNPNQMRSQFAQFDPGKKSSANLLASRGAGLGLGGAGIAASLGLTPQDSYAQSPDLGSLLAMQGEPLNTDRIQGADPLSGVGRIADYIQGAERNVDGPASLLIPTGASDYIRKLQYGDDIGYMDRLFANPLF